MWVEGKSHMRMCIGRERVTTELCRSRRLESPQRIHMLFHSHEDYITLFSATPCTLLAHYIATRPRIGHIAVAWG